MASVLDDGESQERVVEGRATRSRAFASEIAEQLQAQVLHRGTHTLSNNKVDAINFMLAVAAGKMPEMEVAYCRDDLVISVLSNRLSSGAVSNGTSMNDRLDDLSCLAFVCLFVWLFVLTFVVHSCFTK
ncbi:MAG: hypothetical protein K9K38_13465 [Rhodoferax sp.]|nr:hypothetical protein [Rhodoferax sp.]MCF8210388.1 hypothetical protein [Rhodoferax sp.]